MAALPADLLVDEDDSMSDECEELIACEGAPPVSAGTLPAKGRSVGEWIASRPWGQVIFRSVDRVLWCIERTILWQNPSPETLVFTGMVRPVNAFVAYPLATFLWVIQHLLFVSGGSTSAIELMRWVQVRRRRLRAIRFLGIRNMRCNNNLSRPENSSIFTQLFWFLGMLPASEVLSTEVKIGTENKDMGPTAEAENKDMGPTAEDSEHNKKRRFSAVSETTDEAAALMDNDDYNSESDSDYVPEYSHSSESSDSDLSSGDEDVEETGEAELNESVHVTESQEEKEQINQPAPKT